MELAPENERVMRLPDELIMAKPFYDMVRYLDKMSQVWLAQISEPSESDKFSFYVARTIYDNGLWSGGTHATPPEDVVEILERLFGNEIASVGP